MIKNFVAFIVITALTFNTVYSQTTGTGNTTTTKAAARTPDTSKAMAKSVKTRVIGGAIMRSDRDIVDNISKSKDHITLTNAILIGTLSQTLKSRGPLTIFAPTDAAFGKLNSGTLDTLYKPAHAADLTRLLTNHVINGRYTSKDIAKQIRDGKGEATFVTLTGSKLKARMNGDRNIVLVDENGKEAIISQFDIEQSNGLVDVVTEVLTPKVK